MYTLLRIGKLHGAAAFEPAGYKINLFPQTTIQCVVFKGIDRDIFIDRKEYDGDIVAQLDAAYEFVLRNINMSSEINGLYRTDIYELPTDCIRDMIFRFSDKTRIGKSTERVRISTDKVRISTDKLNKSQKKIVQYIEERGAITNKEVQNLLNVKDSRALKVLKELVEVGVLKKEGKLRGSYYKLKR